MSSELPVSVWEDWEIVEKIGEGSFGKVYKAKQVKEGKTRYSAIKIISIPASQSELDSIRSEIRNESEVRAYFRELVDDCVEEVAMMIRLRGNSHIVSVEDFKVADYLDEIGWDIHIRMEYLTGFAEYYSEHPLMEEEVIQLGIDICKALEHCKRRNVIHRDIKSENIFRAEDGRFKLGDFGIARQMERTMSALSKKGTFSYMAPEMYRGEQYDHRADIYSLGIVLYKLRNKNRLPFINLNKQLITYRDKENALTRRMSGEKLSLPVEAREEFGEIIVKACAYDLSERYASPEQMRQDLEKLLKQKYPELSEFAAVEPAAKPEKKTAYIDKKDKAEKTELYVKGKERTERTSVTENTAIPKRRAVEEGKDMGKTFTYTAVLLVGAIIIALLVMVKMNLLPFHSAKEKEAQKQEQIRKEMLEERLDTIQQQINEITKEIDVHPGEGTFGIRVQYRNDENQVIKTQVFPARSDEEASEEYYYWDETCFFAYIWKEDDNSEKDIINKYYFDEEGNLIRWTDTNDVNHDFDTDNEEFTELGEHYKQRAVEEMRKALDGY
ncbi:MAG: serine/threonine protein kinase [Clostridiales bacterium]|nr:serine/threonine protein kinase [Candidatus Blautia equi]